MKVIPMTESEARAAAAPPVLPDGDYDFEVATAVEKNSKSSGMGMFEIDLRIYLPDGKTRIVRDWVMTEGKAAHRLRQCCQGLGVLDRYEAGEVTERDLEGRSGRITLRTEPDEQYGPKNRVKAYLAPTTHATSTRPAARRPAMAPAGGGDIDDDIPFGPEWR